jgi:hypothetical protein
MKRLLFSVALFLLGCQLFAQDFETKKTPEERAHFQTAWMKSNLKLAADQEPRVDQINLKYARQMEDVKSIPSKMGKPKKAKSIMDAKDAELKMALNTDQYQLYLDKKEEIRAKMKEANQERKKQ